MPYLHNDFASWKRTVRIVNNAHHTWIQYTNMQKLKCNMQTDLLKIVFGDSSN